MGLNPIFVDYDLAQEINIKNFPYVAADVEFLTMICGTIHK